MIKCAVIEDEPLARECLEDYIEEVDFLDLTLTCSNPVELLNHKQGKELDLLFLDIKMPMMSGIDYLKSVKDSPMVILTTAFPNYAIEGYSLDILDYLLKPITFNRFFQAISKAKDYYSLINQSAESNKKEDELDYFFVKCNQVYEKVYFDDVLFVEAKENYVMVFTDGKKYMILMPMTRMEELLGAQFMRVHKSYIVALSKITTVGKDNLLINSHKIPVSRSNRQEVYDRVVDRKLWKK